MATLEDFKKLDLRVGIVIEAEPLKGSKNLLKLKVDLGENNPRQIVAGLRRAYNPQELVNKQVIVLANLKPAKIFGVESQGMLLAAVDGEKISLLTVKEDIAPGSEIE